MVDQVGGATPVDAGQANGQAAQEQKLAEDIFGNAIMFTVQKMINDAEEKRQEDLKKQKEAYGPNAC